MTGRPFSRRAFLRLAAASALGAVGGATYVTELEPEWVEVTRLPLELPRLGREFDGYRLAHISDIHMDEHVEPGHMEEVSRLLAAESPDAVAISGDFVTYDPDRFAPRLISFLSDLPSRDGVVAVLGNHDHWSDPRSVRRTLERSGVGDVSNGVHTVRRGAAALHLAGVDDYMEREDRLDHVLGQVPAQGAAVLLVHEPDYAELSAPTVRFDLQLSGHSHGGQVRVPFVGAPRLPRYGRKYPIGLSQVGSMRQYTNRGIGMLPPRVRLNCRPEITIFTLRAASSQPEAPG
jgi:predicted MPP superfamily phosphohydrolase